MAEELEIKLTLQEGAKPQVLAWLGLLADEAAIKRLVNRYYDTPDQALNHERAALRVRQADTHYIQTLKTQGHFVDGAHRRQEWEWPLPGADLSIGLLADTAIADRVNLAALGVVFETNFDRHVVLLESDDATVEFALDTGSVIAGTLDRPLAEVEFELKAGNASGLLYWARKLASEVPMFLNLVSKAEQGYWLAGLSDPASEVDSDDAVTAFLRALSVHWLTGNAHDSLKRTLAAVEVVAHDNDVASQWRWLNEQLSSSEDRGWLFDPRLSQLQLGLLNV